MMLRRSSWRLVAAAIGIAAALVVSLASVRGQGFFPSIAAFRERVRSDVAADGIGGITAAVVAGHRVVWSEGFGWANRHARTPARTDTIYRIGSITKTFTAVVLAQLVDRGTIALDDPVERYLPEIRGLPSPAGATPITFRQLASHTAGLIREPQLAGAASGPIAEWEAKVLASIPHTALDSSPGDRYSYSNIGFGILGLTLSRAAKTPFMALVENGIFTPLRMTSSTFIATTRARFRPLLSIGYNNTGLTIDTSTPAREHLGRGYKVPNGGIYSTVGDLAKFIGALTGAGKTVTSETMRLAMMTNQTLEAGDYGYGFGLELFSAPGAITVVGHGGGVAGYTAQIAFDPESKVGVILLRNYNSGRTNLAAVAVQLVRTLAAESMSK